MLTRPLPGKERCGNQGETAALVVFYDTTCSCYPRSGIRDRFATAMTRPVPGYNRATYFRSTSAGPCLPADDLFVDFRELARQRHDVVDHEITRRCAH